MGEARAPTLSFYVQHLLGIGHLARAFRIAAALVADGWDAEVLVGGDLPSGFVTGAVPIVTLPPVRAAAGGLSTLVHPDGRVFDATARAGRRDRLLAHMEARRPDVLLIEAFPFGRRQMRFELLPLLEQARSRPAPPLVASSVRDILQESIRPERTTETVDTLHRFFDAVLVHGDPALARLEDSFPSASAFSGKIAYTGLVAPPLPPVPDHARYDVVVSVGGGAVGEILLRAALSARERSAAAGLRWLVLAGPNLPDDALARLRHETAADVTLARFVPDLAEVLAGAKLSISQAGYNTVADLLAAGCRAVLVPYARDGETEQTSRAELLAAAGRAVVLPEAGLEAGNLPAAIDAALAGGTRALRLDLDGARRTATLLRELLSRHRRYGSADR